MMRSAIRVLGLLTVVLTAMPIGVHAHPSARVPFCRSGAARVPAVNLEAGFLSLHGLAVDGYVLSRYKVWTPGETANEFDVVNAQIGFDMPGVVGGGSGTIGSVASGAAVENFSGALRLEAASFTGHVKHVPRVRYCRSVRDPRKIVRTEVSEIWLSGYGHAVHGGNPNPAGVSSPAGAVTQLVLKPGSTRSW